MCGIWGYVGRGRSDALSLCLEGLRRLEYRGYDSAGLACLMMEREKELLYQKVAGKVGQLSEAVAGWVGKSRVIIGHTRWATHGKPSSENAHPHLDAKNEIALIHNGIIENEKELRRELQQEGILFRSETDSEVLVHLIARCYKGNLREALQEALQMVQGAYAIAVIHAAHPEEIVVAANESPLAIGIGVQEGFIASDTHAFLIHTADVIYLHDGEVASLTPEGVQVFDAQSILIPKKVERIEGSLAAVSKNGFSHYMLKEIYEQPQTIRNVLLSRFIEERGTAAFDEWEFSPEELRSIERILIVACGTSWHAGLHAAYQLEELARLPVQVEIGSEFRYRNPIHEEGTLVLAISQSGETADTLAAFRELKARGASICAICNVHGSTLAREADWLLPLRAGVEVGVASTKAFTSQVTLLSLIVLMLARQRSMSQQAGALFLEALKRLPSDVEEVLNLHGQIKELASRYGSYQNMFFVGRRHMFPTALEGALKLKEISYLHAVGYPAGELKHGPIALIDPDVPTLACAANRALEEKLLSNLREIQAREGPILIFCDRNQEPLFREVATDLLVLPPQIDDLAVVPTSIALQLFAYEIALKRGTSIDQPRNLAKSVTVE